MIRSKGQSFNVMPPLYVKVSICADPVAYRRPNKALELTGKKLALFPRSSPRAFGVLLESSKGTLHNMGREVSYDDHSANAGHM